MTCVLKRYSYIPFVILRECQHFSRAEVVLELAFRGFNTFCLPGRCSAGVSALLL